MTPPRLIGIDHVQLGMPAGGEDAARAFYSGLLGLLEVAKPQALAGRGGVWFATVNVAVHLSAEVGFRAATRAHPAFVVDDLAALRQRLSETGTATVDDDSGLPVNRCYVFDPFGNRIELVAAADAGFTVPQRVGFMVGEIEVPEDFGRMGEADAGFTTSPVAAGPTTAADR